MAMVVVLAASSLAATQSTATPAGAAPPAAMAGSTARDAGGAARTGARPDAVSAMLAARQQGLRIEDLSARTETSSTYANPDGTFTAEQHTGPIRFRDHAGEWRDVDVTFDQGADGSVRSRAHPLGLALGAPGGAPGHARDLVTLSADGRQVTLRWRGQLPRPVVDGTTATYPNLLAGVDLVVEATRTGFEQFLVVKSRPADPAALAVTLPMVLRGLTARPAGGGVEFVDRDGRIVGSMPEPAMWDARVEAGSGIHTHRAPVAMRVSGSGAAVDLRLVPDADFLLDPATVYPVTIDPSYSSQLYPTFDTWVEVGYGDQSASTELRSGTHDDGTNVSRSFLNLNMSPWAGKHILDADLALWNYHSWSCLAREWRVWSTGLASTATRWTAQPTWNTLWGSSTQTKGYDTTCGDGWVFADLTSLIQTWANQSAGAVAIGVRAASETDHLGWKRFHSGNNASNIPRINITYNSYPATPTSLAVSECFGGGCSGTRVTGTTTPALTASATDPDAGALLRYDFELWSGNADAPTGSPLATASFPNLSSGQAKSWTVPAGTLAHGGAYEYRVRAYDGSDYGPWSAWLKFSVDLDAPATGNVTSAAFPLDRWSPATTSGTFTFTSPSTDVAGWRYWFDGNAPTDVAGGATYTTPSLSPGAGWHVLHVQALDKGFNRSGEALYGFGNGMAVTAPADGQRTAARVPLAAVAPPGHTGVRFQYRLPGQTTWLDLPVGDVTRDGSALTAWPVGTDGSDPALSRTPANMAWNLAATRANTDGPVELRAEFSGGPTSPQATSTVTVTLETRATGGSYASAPIGPGAVALVNGAFTVSLTDVSVKASRSDLTVGRTFNSLQPDTDGVFGRGWQPSLLMGSAGVPWTRLDDAGTSVALAGEDGGTLFFAPGSTAGTYKGVGEALASGLKLTATGTGATKVFALADLDGTVVTFTTTSAAPTVFRVATVQRPGQGQTTTYTYDAGGRPTRVLAPVPPGVTCTGATLAVGCRALDLTYANNRVSAITLNTTNTAGTSVQVAVACFGYDANGRLAQSWDPRPAGTTCTTPVLATGYGYDAVGRLTSITPPGLRPWTIDYDAAGRLWKVSRSHGDGSGTETTTLRYGVPIGATTTDAQPDLSPGWVAQWGQRVAPVTAVAVFEPGDDTADLRNAEIHALDASGREVNTAVFSGTGQPGWKVDTIEHDRFGNTVRTLAARNRDLALAGNPTSLGLPEGSSSVEIARALDEVNSYAADGMDLLDSYGPWHYIAIDGGWIYARPHVHRAYGRLEEPGVDPTVDGPKHAVIEQTAAASRAVTASPVDETDARSARSSYALSASDATGWTFNTPMAITTEMGGEPDIVYQTRYHATTGQVIETRQPAAAGTSASPGTARTTYYAAGAHNPAACVSSAWFGLACKIEPGAQPGVAGLPQLPTKTFQYDVFQRATVATETVVDAGGTARTRATTTTYENAGNGPRQIRAEVTGGLGTAVPATTTSYDPATGLPTVAATATTPAAEIRTQYDDFGRPRSVTDADNATTETTYGPASGRVQTVTSKDPAGAVLGTQTLGYDGGPEHRGLTTSISDSGLGGTITAAYDAGGALTAQTMPNGITATHTIDPTGDTTRVAYAKGGTFWFDDRQDSNIHGQWRWHSGPSGWEAYGYDRAARLRVVWDQRNGQPCVQRGYAFDANSNRTALDFWPANAAGTCPPSTTSTSTGSSYDAADRLQPTGIAAGLTYDAFGRITTLPAALAGGAATTIGYHSTDMVASQTQGGLTRSWTVDPAGRMRAAAMTGQPTKTNHYGGGGDSPTWIEEGDGTRTRYVAGFDGNLAAAVSSTGTTVTGVRYLLVGLHGDVITSASPGAATPDGAFLDYSEFGGPRGTTPATRYGWLGGKQRSADSLGGLTLMGVRLYHPGSGRFLQTDPAGCGAGGSATMYDYARQDPINTFDLDGRLPNCGFSIWGVRWGPPDRISGLFDFGYACYWHDRCYIYAWFGRGWWGRLACDLGFLSIMRSSCRRMHPWWSWRRYACYGVAWTYYYAVRWLGEIPWWYHRCCDGVPG